MNRILVTGASGFVGQYLIRELVSRGGDIYAACYQPHPTLTKLLGEDHVFPGDLTDHSYVKQLISGIRPDIIYHLAALSIVHHDVPTARRALENNLGLQYNLLEEVRQLAPSARLMAICSGNIYGKVNQDELPIKESTPIRPLNAYSVSKLSQEILALQYFYAHSLDVVILRPFNHTGPGQTDNFVIPAFAKQFAAIKKGQQDPIIKVGNLDTARDFTDVEDMVQAYLVAADNCKSGEIYNIGSGKASKIIDILSMMREISGLTVEIEVEPNRQRGVDVPILMADATKFREATGWQPKIPFKETLAKVLKYWEEQT